MKPLPASIRTQINSNPDFHDDLGGCHEEDSVFHGGGGGGCEDWSYSDGGGGNPYDISGNSFVYERRRTNETDDYEFLDEVRLTKIFGSGNSNCLYLQSEELMYFDIINVCCSSMS